jgi:hypothetical protein
MPSTEDIKAKICLDITNPEYPLRQFLEWMEHEQRKEVLRELEKVQRELDEDVSVWRQAAAYGNVSKELNRANRWCLYCAQLRAYYQAVLKDPKVAESVLNIL